MRFRSPSSKVSIKTGFSPFDVFWAAVSPLLALYVRQAYILSDDGLTLTIIYCLVSLAFSLIAFAVFDIRAGIFRYLSIHDAIDLAKAVALGELMTCGLLFSVTRLEGVPRSTPLIHALILGAGLFAIRILCHLAGRDRAVVARSRQHTRNIIVVGLSDLSFLYMKVLEALAVDQRVICLLDDERRSIGRLINGVKVYGPCAHLESLVEEFAVHGIRTHRVVVGGDARSLSKASLQEIQRVCASHGLELEFVPSLFGFGPGNARLQADAIEPTSSETGAPAGAAIAGYFRFKRYLDFSAAVILSIVSSPILALSALLVFMDVGSPVVFWQQRIGLNGRHILVLKFRTLRAPFDRQNRRIREDRQLSWFGNLLRRTRLDELPQLWNVLIGDMCLIGPRPLVAEDQLSMASLRLVVRPGISGWAQVNGGNLLSNAEKQELDEWYIGHASLWLDLRIAVLTLRSLVKGDRRSEPALAQARLWRSRRDEEVDIDAANDAGAFLSAPQTRLRRWARRQAV